MKSVQHLDLILCGCQGKGKMAGTPMARISSSQAWGNNKKRQTNSNKAGLAATDYSTLLVQFCPMPPCQTAPLHWVQFHVVPPSGPFPSFCFLEMNKLLDKIKWGQSPQSKRRLFICKDSAEPGVYLPPPSAEHTHSPMKCLQFIPFPWPGLVPVSFPIVGVFKSLHSLPIVYFSVPSPLISFLVRSSTMPLSQFTTTFNRLTRTNPDHR